MAGMCCGVKIGETEASAPAEPSSRSARRRRMEIHQFNFVPTDSSLAPPMDGGVKRKKQKLEAVVPVRPPREFVNAVKNCEVQVEAEKKSIEVSGEIAPETEAFALSTTPSDARSDVGVIQPDRPKFGMTSVCGRRRDMEDAVAIHPSFCGENNSIPNACHFFGVYDGHGCSHVATRCKDRMHQIVRDELQNGGASSWERTMLESFSKMDKDVGDCCTGGADVPISTCRCELQTPQCDAVGSTAVVAVVTPDKIVVSNCGDSRAVLCRNGVAVPLSVDHKPDRPDELNRIQEAGGRVIFWDGPRVLGVLAMSRAIGDNYLKPYVISEPEVTITERTAEDECLILASDGLWDVVSNETACGVARMCLQSRKPPSPPRSPGNDLTVTAAGESSDKACSDASILLTKLALARPAISLFPPNSECPLLVFVGDDGGSEMPLSKSEFLTSYEAMIVNGDSNFDWIQPESESDPLTLNYTSGTTSSPKGVVHSHRGTFLVSIDSLVEWSVPKEPVYLWTLPMFHANGWSYTWGMAAAGGTNVCLRKFDAATIYAAIRKHHVTHMCGAPVVLNMLCNVPDGKPLERPVNILTAGAPPPASVLFRTESLGFVVSHGYGLTETGGLVVCCTWKQKWNKFPAAERARLKARQGVRTRAMADVDVIEPESGKSVKRDGKTLGEIVLRGGSIMLGYLRDPESTAKAMKNGWFYTGDVGVMHPDGYLEIKDRSKDVIISGGENLSSVEVESVLYAHPAVNEAAVVARPDDFWGETPCAFVSLKEGLKDKPSENDVIAYCREKLPRFMVPRTVVFKEELPKTSTGKIQKFVLREMAKAMGSSKMSRL